jgi:small subunit ribosomal protein S6
LFLLPRRRSFKIHKEVHMRIYETGFLLAPSLSEEETEKIITQMTDVVSQKEGKLIRQEKWGKRRMAYPIKRFNEAFYVFLHYEGKEDIPLELARRFKQTDAVLRYLTLKKEAQEAVRKKKKKEADLEEKEGASAAGEGSEKKVRAEESLPSPETKEEVR